MQIRAIEKIELVKPFLFCNEGFFQLPIEMWLNHSTFVRNERAEKDYVLVVGWLITDNGLSTDEGTLILRGTDFYVIPYVNLAGDECKRWSRILENS